MGDKQVYLYFNFELKAGTYTTSDVIGSNFPVGHSERFLLFATALGIVPFIINENGEMKLNVTSLTVASNSWMWGGVVYISE